jgi:hypothetical protein
MEISGLIDGLTDFGENREFPVEPLNFIFQFLDRFLHLSPQQEDLPR